MKPQVLENHLELQLAYWKQQLADLPLLLQLPTDRPRPLIQRYHGQTLRFSLNCSVTDQLYKLSQAQGTTLFTTLLAAFATLLYRYSGQTDIAIASLIVNPTRAALEPPSRSCMNMVVLRACFEDNPSFIQLLAQLQKVTLEAYTHQDVPFEEVVKALQLERDLSDSPLFQVMFVLQNTPMSTQELTQDRLTSLSPETIGAGYELNLWIEETETGLLGSLQYNSELFDHQTITRMVGHFQTLLKGIVANPEERVGHLPLLTQVEQHQILVEWNDTAVEYPKDKCIDQLFEAQVERTPDAVALVFEGQQLTYRQLNERSNQVAHYLQSLGVGREVLVGLCIERSLEMVLGLLGILKAGGAYVPIDPSYPEERLGYMLADAKVKILLSLRSLQKPLPEHQGEVVYLDADWQVIGQQSKENPDSGVRGENLAYVIYTSGSTGTPKGVRVGHNNLCHYVQAMQIALGITAEDVYLHTASIAFSSSTRQLILPLTQGATVTIATSEQRKDPLALFAKIKQHDVTVIDIVPSYWRNCNYALGGLTPESKQALLDNKLRLILSASEALMSDIPSHWRSNFQQGTYAINMFGQTETCGIVSTYPIPAQQGEGVKVVLIGRPIPNTQIYLLDRHLQPVPIGVPGELYIGGRGVGQGYLHRPDLTAEKFIPNPFSNEPDTRLYKTGDLARYLSDGNIEYIGRIDQQVKIRGFRIELGEIEAAIGEHPKVREAAVIVREDTPGNKRLVAYIVTSDQSTNPDDLRSFLKQKLPEYMMPSAFLLREALPLTPNGKVDRKALLATAELTGEEEFVPPQTPIHQTIANIFSAVLGVQAVGIHDNFFEMGGNSVLVMIAINDIEEKTKQELHPVDLFNAPTVAKLADYLNRECLPVLEEGEI